MSCPAPPISKLYDGPLRSLSDSLKSATDAVSDKAGIVHRVYYEELRHDDPAFYWAVSEPANAESVVGHRRPSNRGNAAAATPELAAMKAIGESLERYCAAFYDENELVMGRRTELPSPAVDPSTFALFTPEQYKNRLEPIHAPEEAGPDEPTGPERFYFSPFTDETNVRWTRARSLKTGDILFVPASFVFIPYVVDYPVEPIVLDQVSTGLACGSSVTEAAYKGLMEVVERDAFMLTWHCRAPASTIELASIQQPTILDLMARFERVPARLEAFLLDITPGIPVVLVVISGARRPYQVVGAAADLSIERALELAIAEGALSFCGWSKFCHAGGWEGAEDDFSKIDDLDKHAFAHAVLPKLRNAMDFLREGELIRLPSDKAETPSWSDRLKRAIHLVADTGHDILAVDLTTPDVEDIGFNVARVIVPGFQPLDINHNHRCLGSNRLENFCAQTGCSGVNPLPHPFP